MTDKTLGQIFDAALSLHLHSVARDWEDLGENLRDAIEVAAQAVVEAHEAQKWRPISEAPKTQEIVLVHGAVEEVGGQIHDMYDVSSYMDSNNGNRGFSHRNGARFATTTTTTESERMMTVLVIKFTHEQTELIKPLIEKIRQANDNGDVASIIGQAWHDGIALKVIKNEQVQGVMQATCVKNKQAISTLSEKMGLIEIEQLKALYAVDALYSPNPWIYWEMRHNDSDEWTAHRSEPMFLTPPFNYRRKSDAPRILAGRWVMTAYEMVAYYDERKSLNGLQVLFGDSDWRDVESFVELNFDYQYSRRPDPAKQYVTIPATRIPRGETVAPKVGWGYKVPCLTNGQMYTEETWSDDDLDKLWLLRGLVYLTENTPDCIEAAKAMLKREAA